MTRITKVSWGKIEVEIDDRVQVFHDCKVWPGGAAAWDWSLTGTHHNPGIQPADIEEILAQGVEVMVLGKGVLQRLGVCPETEQLLKSKGIEYYIEETNRAVKAFNRLVSEGRKVGGIFHSTC